MNRHRANWSVMGVDREATQKTCLTDSEFYEILKPHFAQNPTDSLTNACTALRRINEEFLTNKEG